MLTRVYRTVLEWIYWNVLFDILPDSMRPSRHGSCVIDTEPMPEYIWHTVITQPFPPENKWFELSPDGVEEAVREGVSLLGLDREPYKLERTVRHVYDAVYVEKINYDLSIAACFRRAAFYGHRDAQYYLAKMFMYSDGLVVPQDHWHIAKWLRKAAVQGHEDAQRELARHADLMRSIGQDQIGEFIDKGYITAVKAKDKQLLNTAAYGKPEHAAYEIANGANVYAVDEDKMTPLMRAAQSNPDPDVLKILICNGSELNAADKDGRTPLMLAAIYNSKWAVMEVLLRSSADVTLKSDEGKRAMDYADTNKRYVRTRIGRLLREITLAETQGTGSMRLAESRDRWFGLRLRR